MSQDHHMSRRKGRRQVLMLAGLAVGMFGFAFALVPLYNVFCELTGLNGKTGGQAVYAAAGAGAVVDREVTVQFLGHVGKGMPWEFRPTEGKLKVRPGEMHTTNFYARNRAGGTVTGQAVPSVAPGQAALYLNKTECFCFRQQTLAAGEELEMPVSFFVDPDLPEHIRTISLSYTLFRVSSETTAQLASR